METKLFFRHVLKYTTYIFVFMWTFISANAQCPTINDANPTILNGAGFTFDDLTPSSVADNGGGGIVWYSVATGGTALSSSNLVYENTYYVTDAGSCGSRTPINVSFQVKPTGRVLDKVYCTNDNPTIQTYIDDVLDFYAPTGGGVTVYYDVALNSPANGTDIIPVARNKYYIVFSDSSGNTSQIELGSVPVYESPADPTPNPDQAFCADPTNPPQIQHLDTGNSINFNWYDSLDSNGNPSGPVLSPLALLTNKTYYIQIDDGCLSNPVAVNVTINTPNDPGTPGSLEFCSDDVATEPPFDLFDHLNGTPDTTGTWAGPRPTTNTYHGNVDISDLTTPGIYTFTYTVPANGACPESSSTVTITIHKTLSSGVASSANPATFCESGLPSSFDLFSLLDNEDTGGQWTEGTLSTDPIVTSPINLTGLAQGNHFYTYTQNLTNPCPEESTTVQVTVLPDPNAGTANNQTFCENDLAANSPFNLFDALTAPYDNGGTWTDASNAAVADPFNLVITGYTVAGSPYNFTYTVDNGTCTDTETISITIASAPESGTANTPVEFCEASAPTSYNLFDLLTGADLTGTWYIGTDNLGATTSNLVDLSAYPSGTHDFTYDVAAIGGCDDVLVTVQVIINPLPNTGTANNPPPFCKNDAALTNTSFDLFTLLTGTVDALGNWNDVSTTPVAGALSGNILDLSQLEAKTYNFSYSKTDVNGCSNSTTVTIQIDDAPESGTPVATFPEFCISEITTGQTVNLFDLLDGEDQTGTWADDDSTLALTGNSVALDGLASLGANTYSFTYDVAAIGSCDDVNVTVSIIINDTPAPTASPTQEFCDSAMVSNLTATGTTIQWYDVASGGTALSGTTALVNGQIYYATQTVGCESSIRTAVTATIYQSPNAGNPNTTPIVACSGNNSIDLNTGLDGTQDAGGVWQDTDGTLALTGNIFDATVNGAGTYQFTYFVSASSPCVDDSTVITVTIEEPLSAGTDNTLDVCSNNGTTDLFTLIGSADTGGTWSPAMASGTGVFDPLVDAQGTYTYSLINACGTFSSKVDVTVTQAPNAGTDDAVLICVIDGPTDLFTFLGTDAQTGGTWSPALTSGTGVFDPLVDTNGTYTYMVSAVSPCVTDSSAQITVTVDDSSAPTVVTANPEFCLEDNPTVADLDASISATGTINWYTDATLTTSLAPTDTLTDGEDYFATQTNSSGCESSQNVQVNVTVNDAPTPTLVNPNLELCINDNPTIMELTLNISEYNSNTDNVIWYDAATGGSSLSSSSLLSYGVTYYAALYDASTGCESSVRLAVTPDVTKCGKIRLPDGFSPNGDGVNDTYDYNNMDILYPNFEIEIFNRYGNIVYKGRASNPRFDGTSNQARTMVKGDLPVGVYFYIFKFNDGENKPEQGRLYLSR